jgi:hypothetical protein
MKLKFTFLVMMLMGLAACSGEPPYVNRPYEINRGLESFPDGPEIVSGSTRTVCSSKSASTPAQIRTLASDECAKSGLGIGFVEQVYDVCPLMTPNAAVFECVASVGGQGTGPRAAANTAPVIQPPSFAAPRPAGAGRTLGSISAADVSTTAKSQPFPTYLFNNGQPTR